MMFVTRPTEEQERAFQRLFKVRLMRFYHPVFGFDVISFDRHLEVPDGKSTADIVLERFGEDAVKFVRSLLDLGLK